MQGRATFLAVQHSRSHHPNHFFNGLNNASIKLIGNDKKSRLKLKLPHERGDLGLPNVKWVYSSAQLCSTIFYFSTESLSVWVNIEQMSVSNLPLKTVFILRKPQNFLQRTTENPFLINTIDIWYKRINALKIPLPFCTSHMG